MLIRFLGVRNVPTTNYCSSLRPPGGIDRAKSMRRSLLKWVRERWHPLWRLRHSPLYRKLQQHFDFTVDVRQHGSQTRVALKLLRDASLLAASSAPEPEVTAAFTMVMEHFRPRVFWDVGANVGRYSWLVREHPGIERVILFEPDPTNFALLNRTIERNGIGNCRALQLAVCESSGEAPFLLDRVSGATGSLELTERLTNTFSLHHRYGLEETITCRTASVDDLIREGLPPPDFIKIDVERAEARVIAGASDCLARTRPVLIMESRDTSMLRDLRARGYRVLKLDSGNVLALPLGGTISLTPFEQQFPDWQEPAPAR